MRAVKQGAKPYFETYVLPKQSAVLKYMMGASPNTRKPGDVGPSQAYIALPIWGHLKTFMGIRPDSFGNMPSSSMRRLRRQANVQKDQVDPNPPNFKSRGGGARCSSASPTGPT